MASKTPAKNQLVSVKLESYSAPEFKEVRGKDWIYWGEKNNYPDELIELYMHSTNHQAIVDGKTHYIAGEGWEGQWIKANPIESLREVTDKLVKDLMIFNGFCFEVIYNQLGQIASIYHVPINKVRRNKSGETFYFTATWNNKPNENDDWTLFAPFDPKKPNEGRQLVYYKSYTPKIGEFDLYPFPEYHGAIPYIMADKEIANFHLNNIKNNFLGSYIINAPDGQMSDDEKKDFKRHVIDEFTGSDNASHFVLSFNKDPAFPTTVEPIPVSEIDKQYEFTEKAVEQKIFTAHKVTSPMLFGIKTEGQLGGRTEMADAYEIFTNTYISAKQQQIEMVINSIAKEMGKGDMKITPTKPLGIGISDDKLIELMSPDEVRTTAGLPPVDAASIDPNKDTLNRLNTMSPLLATKVVDSLSTDEIRALAGLKPIVTPNNPALPNQIAQKFKEVEDEQSRKLLILFAEFGRPRSEYQILKSRKVRFEKDKLIDNSNEMIRQCFAISGKLEGEELKIMREIDKGAKDAKTIAKALDISQKTVDKIIKSLVEAGLISAEGGTLEITPAGEEQSPPVEEPLTSIELRYHYDVAPGLGAPIIDTTRDFCRKLIQLDRMYTRREIEQISNQVGYSVWLYRGGWYHNPKTTDTTPYCRHLWTQNVVTLKK